MVKKMIIFIMVLTFLNLTITPDFVSASKVYRPQPSTKEVWAAVAGLVLVLVALFVLTPQLPKAISSDDQFISQNQDEEQSIDHTLDMEVSPVTPDKLLTIEGEFVVLRW